MAAEGPDRPFSPDFRRHFDRVFRRSFGKLTREAGGGSHALSGGL